MQESIVFLVRVQCRRKESSRSLSQLLMSFLLLLGVLTSVPVLFENWSINAPRGVRMDSYTDTLTDANWFSGFIICPMLYAIAMGQIISWACNRNWVFICKMGSHSLATCTDRELGAWWAYVWRFVVCKTLQRVSRCTVHVNRSRSCSVCNESGSTEEEWTDSSASFIFWWNAGPRFFSHIYSRYWFIERLFLIAVSSNMPRSQFISYMRYGCIQWYSTWGRQFTRVHIFFGLGL